jgi:hypothetical protein
MQTWCFVADIHCGSPVGLSPTPKNPVQAGLLNRYLDAIDWFGERPDVVVCVGDVSEGIDPKLDIDDPSIASQFLKAAELLAMWKPTTEYIIITGTKTHTHVLHQELEKLLIDIIKQKHWDLYRKEIEVTVHRKLNTRINDWFFLSARHFINSSSIPHGRVTPIVRSQMWGILNAALKSFQEEGPLEWPDLLVFGHVHYYDFHKNAWGATLVVPCFKGIGDKFGDELCDGSVNLGVSKIVIEDTREEGWKEDTRLYNASVVSRVESR